MTASEAYAEAGAMAEFGKVACITAGVIRHKEGETDPFFITSTYSGDSERDVLCGFAEMVGNFLSTPAQDHVLCGHGVLAADIPFFAGRQAAEAESQSRCMSADRLSNELSSGTPSMLTNTMSFSDTVCNAAVPRGDDGVGLPPRVSRLLPSLLYLTSVKINTMRKVTKCGP